MDMAFEWARALSAVAFLGFGIACLDSDRMREEFGRYGLTRWRTLIGTLEICGAFGLFASISFPALVVPAASGLALLMLMGVITRIRIRDPLLAMLPALALLVLNAYLLTRGLGLGSST
jgi:hypothetical protein